MKMNPKNSKSILINYQTQIELIVLLDAPSLQIIIEGLIKCANPFSFCLSFDDIFIKL